MTSKIDLVIPAHPKDFPLLNLVIGCAKANIQEVRRVFVVSPEPCSAVSEVAQFVPEPEGPDFPTVDYVRRRWEREYSPLAFRAGWIYQQLLVLGAPSYIEDLLPTYLSIDADTIFLRRVEFLRDGARFLYTNSGYHAPPHMEAYRCFTGEEPVRPSFNCHHMLYDVELLEDLFAHVERLHGKAWFDAFLDCVDYREVSSTSEQDSYANWVLTHHPDVAVHRQLSWADISYVPNRWQRRWLGRSFDFVSAHAYKRRTFPERIRDRLGGMVTRLSPRADA